MKRFLIAFILIFGYGVLLLYEAGHAQNAVNNKIEKLAKEHVLSLCKECEVLVETKWMASELKRIDTSRIAQLQFDEVGLPRGYQSINVSYQKEGRLRTRKAQVYIELSQQLPVANKRIERNTTIVAGDLTWKKKNITRVRRLPLDSKEDVVGQSASNLIRKADVIHHSDLQQTPIIEAGDSIKMVYSAGGVEVALDCRARQAKAKGEQIRVYSDKTRKTYLAKVVTPQKVVWEKTL